MRSISVDRERTGRIKANSVPTRFDKIKNKFTWNNNLQPDAENSSEEEDNYPMYSKEPI